MKLRSGLMLGGVFLAGLVIGTAATPFAPGFRPGRAKR